MNVRMKYTGLAYAICLAAVITSACTRTQAKVAPDDPALEVPVPPARVIAAISPEVPQPVGVPPVVPSGTGLDRVEPSRAAAGTTPRRTEPRPNDNSKPDNPDLTEPPKPPEDPRTGTSPLTTTTTQRESEVEAGIRSDVQRAQSILNRVDYQRLSSDARTQYDLAKGYLQQVEENLRGKNFSLAKTLAEKAVILAAQLGR